MSDNKRIAKNTIFLYIRMLLIMGVTLFTSRVVLDKLGVDDYALYNVVGGMVGMLAFLNGTLSTGTSRFLTFELGAGNKDRLKRTFTTAFFSHLMLSLVILLLMETGGLWYLYNKLVVSPDRLFACFVVFQLSIFTTMVSITQVPYTASIMSHEKMDIYAYMSIVEALAKFAICYAIVMTAYDRLIVYASLYAIVQVGVALLYRLYCKRHFEECALSFNFDMSIFKSLLGFSGWNVLANLTETLKVQGVLILMNMFLQPFVVASQAIANQVAHAMMQFVENIRTAINPQIIKSYAAGDYEGSKKLTLLSATYVYDVLLLLGLPLILLIRPILNIWLVDVPEGAVVFVQVTIAIRIIGNFSSAFYMPMVASGKVKKNSMAAMVLGIGQFVLMYILLKLGYGEMVVLLLPLCLAAVFAFYIKPYILIKDIDYKISDLLPCYWACLKVTFLSCLFSVPAYCFFDITTIVGFSIVLIVSVMSVLLASLLFMDSDVRMRLIKYVFGKIGKSI